MSDLPQHIVKSYEQELKQLRDMLVKMGGLLEAQLATATAAVVQGDAAAATAAMEQDPAVDAVHINSPIHLHVSQSIAALRAGKHRSEERRVGKEC